MGAYLHLGVCPGGLGCLLQLLGVHLHVWPCWLPTTLQFLFYGAEGRNLHYDRLQNTLVVVLNISMTCSWEGTIALSVIPTSLVLAQWAPVGPAWPRTGFLHVEQHSTLPCVCCSESDMVMNQGLWIFFKKAVLAPMTTLASLTVYLIHLKFSDVLLHWLSEKSAAQVLQAYTNNHIIINTPLRLWDMRLLRI